MKNYEVLDAQLIFYSFDQGVEDLSHSGVILA